MGKSPDWEGFGRAIINHWPESDIDMLELQEMAEKHHIIIKEPNGYDKAKHGYHAYAVKGDDWFLKNFKPLGMD